MTALENLKSLYLQEHRRKYPSLPEYARTCKPYTDKTANGLTRCLCDFLKLNGHFAQRINTTGIPVDKRINFVDSVGIQRTIGSITWRKAPVTRGNSDIQALINSKAIFIEIKAGKDKQSQYQKDFQKEVERNGAIYLLIHSFEQFYNWYNQSQHGNN